MCYLFSTFLCQDRLTFLGHNLSNPETMCHNVSVSKQPEQNHPNIAEYLYFHVTQFPLFSPDWFLPSLTWYSRSGSGWQNSLWRGTGGIYERRKCVNCQERVCLMWLIWLDTKVWAETKWRELIRAQPGLGEDDLVIVWRGADRDNVGPGAWVQTKSEWK